MWHGRDQMWLVFTKMWQTDQVKEENWQCRYDWKSEGRIFFLNKENSTSNKYLLLSVLVCIVLLTLVTDRNVTEWCDKMTTKTNHNRFVPLQKLSGPLCLIREEEEEVAAHHLYCQQWLDFPSLPTIMVALSSDAGGLSSGQSHQRINYRRLSRSLRQTHWLW